MKRLRSLAATSLGLLGAAILVGQPLAFAATPAGSPSSIGGPGSGQALEIAPPVMSLTVNPGQVVKTQIKLRDISKDPLIVTNEVDDFVAAGEDGTPKILTGNDTNNPFTMKAWVAPISQLDLQPQQIKTLNVTIDVPATASPGGHYGVIRFTGTPPNLHGTGVSLSASLGALVLLTVTGNIKDQLSVQQFSANKNGHTGSLFQSAPVNFTLRLKNSGNVQEEPTGHIAITDMFGKPVASLLINTPPHNVLPDSIRKFDEQLGSTTIGNRHLFGHYHAVMNVEYGTSNKHTLTASLSFWIIPYRLIGIIVLALIVAFLGLRYLIRFYNRRIIAKAQQSASRSHKKK